MPDQSTLFSTNLSQFHGENQTFFPFHWQNATNVKILARLEEEFMILYAIIHVIIVVIGIIMNISVIILFSIGKELRRPINNLIVALAMTDLLINLIGTPFCRIASFYKEWLFGDNSSATSMALSCRFGDM